MARDGLIRCGLLALMIGCLSAAPAQTSASPPESQVQKLKDQLELETARNAQLQTRIQDLQRQLQDMSAQMSRLQAQLRAPATTWSIPQLKMPRVAPYVRPLPPGWGEGQFNGQPFYIIPCQGTAPIQAVPATP